MHLAEKASRLLRQLMSPLFAFCNIKGSSTSLGNLILVQVARPEYLFHGIQSYFNREP